MCSNSLHGTDFKETGLSYFSTKTRTGGFEPRMLLQQGQSLVKQCRLTERHQAFCLGRVCQRRKVTRLPEVQFSFHFTNLAEEVGIVVLDCVIRQVRPEYFYAVKFQYFGFFMFWGANPHCFGFFLFRRKPDMLPKLPMICNENFRELVSYQSSVIGKLWDFSFLQVGKTYAFTIWLLSYFQGK